MNRAIQTPLVELLAGIPSDARLLVESDDGKCSRSIPVGVLAREAIAALTGAQPAPAAPSDAPRKSALFELRERIAAQPADSAMEVLIELVALQDLQRSRAQAEAHAAKFQTPDNYAVVDKLWSDIARRTKPAWDRARALTAASKERSKTHE